MSRVIFGKMQHWLSTLPFEGSLDDCIMRYGACEPFEDIDLLRIEEVEQDGQFSYRLLDVTDRRIDERDFPFLFKIVDLECVSSYACRTIYEGIPVIRVEPEKIH